MRCVTWSRDSHGLFDYESRQISKQNLKTHTGGRIIRIRDEMLLVPGNVDFKEKYGEEAKPLLLLH